MRILLIGSQPPPLGGVGVFIERYRHKLEGEGHSVEVLDPSRVSNGRLLRHLLTAPTRRYDLISLNYPSLPVMLILLALGLAPRTEVFDHNWRLIESWDAPRRRLYGAFLKRCRELLLTSPRLKDYYREHGVGLPEKTRVQHAFLPPRVENEARILESYTAELREFIGRSRPLIIANAFKLIYHDGVDLYGLDMCLRLVLKLKETYPDIGLLFALAEAGDAEREPIEREALALGVGHHFFLMSGQRELWPLFKRAHLFVRPTLTDGYAVSVAEALHFDCPVVASDAAERPNGVRVFKSRDEEDFKRRCLEALAARGAHVS
ncbi:MAG: glycosyltransferase [Pyrinomonadaceae bacterium]